MATNELNPLLRNAFTYLTSLGRIKNKRQVATDLDWPVASSNNYLLGKRPATQEYLEKFATHYEIKWEDFSQLKTPVKLQSIPKESMDDFIFTKLADLEKLVALSLSLQLSDHDPGKIKELRDRLGPTLRKILDGNEQA